MNITILGNIILSSAMQEEAVNEMSMKIINAVANRDGDTNKEVSSCIK